MPPVPLRVALLGLFGNACVFAVLFFRGDPFWVLFLVTSFISYGAAVRAGKRRTYGRKGHRCTSTGSTAS